MANTCKNTITIIRLKEAPEIFVKVLSKAMFGIDLDNMDPRQWGENGSVDGKTWYASLVEQYRQTGSYPLTYCILYPHEPYDKLGVTAPRFYLDTKREPPVKEMIEASKVFPDLTFHLDWWVEEEGPSGELVIRNGEDIDHSCRPASWYLFDHSLLYPTISLLPAHLPYTLAQRGVLRLEDAIQAIDDLVRVLDDDRFRISAFSECRDREKTEKVRASLAGIHELLVEQAKQVDFTDVLLEEHELAARLPRIFEADKTLMEGLGLKPLLPASGRAVRFCILPFQVAAIDKPCKVIVPAVHYLNADPTSGKYVKLPDGSSPPIEWELRHVCLTPSDAMQIIRLPDEDQTPFDVDLIMTNTSDLHFGYALYRASNKARWRLNALDEALEAP